MIVVTGQNNNSGVELYLRVKRDGQYADVLTRRQTEGGGGWRTKKTKTNASTGRAIYSGYEYSRVKNKQNKQGYSHTGKTNRENGEIETWRRKGET